MPRPKKGGVTENQSGERIAKLEETLATLTQGMGTLTELVQQLGQKVMSPPKLPMAVKPDIRLKPQNPGDMAQRRKMRDILFPGAEAGGFQEGDVVQPKDGTPKAGLMVYNDEQAIARSVPAGTKAYGVVKSFMYVHRKTKQRKYKVEFPEFGEDGLLENELELVERAI